MLINVRSLMKPHCVERLAADIIANDIDMCFVTETWPWLNSEVHNSFIKIDGYSVLRSDKGARNSNMQIGGCVVVHYRDGFTVCQFFPYGCEVFEFLWFSDCAFLHCCITPQMLSMKLTYLSTCC